MTEIERRPSRYTADAVGIGIVHLGFGAFHRAHQAAYVESWLERHGGGPWGICAANIRSNFTLCEQLRAQDYRYHIAEYANSSRVRLSEIRSIRRALYAREDPEDLLAQMTRTDTRIVSLTVSEKGYYLNPATGDLLAAHPEIAHDIVEPRRPRTAPGLVLEAIRRRLAAGQAPFTVLCCDNMPDNGRRTRRALRALAALSAPELVGWIEAELACPSTMVDRIVPAVTPESRRRLEKLIGFEDPVAVACEAFSQWVVEDRFAAGRPDWEDDAVEMVADVAPYETMKLRLLNGAHSLLAYVGLERGRATVSEAMADAELATLLERYFDEAQATLEGTPGIDYAAYRRSLISRFANDALEHRLSQIAMDGSQKLPQRLLEGAAINVVNGRDIPATAEAIAAWMRYVAGRDADGRAYRVDDPIADRLARCHRENREPEDLVAALLAVREVFPAGLAERPAFRAAVLDAYRRRADRASA